MDTNPEGTAQTYIFLVDNQDIALNIVMSGYQALCLVQEDDGYYFSVDSFIEELETGANLGTLKADKLLLERAIMNVISNALDYSPPQGTIYVTVQKTDCFLHISITDEGGGFTPEALHHAQEQFFMGDKSRTSNMHFGMGLYITSSIIKQHGGQLVLSNSKKTGGAQAIIKIPY